MTRIARIRNRKIYRDNRIHRDKKLEPRSKHETTRSRINYPIHPVILVNSFLSSVLSVTLW
jgi:hypothetical protein